MSSLQCNRFEQNFMFQVKFMVFFPKLADFWSFSRELTCTICHMSNFSYEIIKFGPKTLCSIIFPLKLVALKLYSYKIIYDCFIGNTYLRLVVGLVKNSYFHSL
jgi:hypothetical protein